MGLFNTAAELREHQKECIHAQEVARQEARQDQAETRRLLERMEDRLAKEIANVREVLDTRMSTLHRENQSDVKAIWMTIRVSLAVAATGFVGFTVYLMEHGGLIGLIKGM